MGREKSTDSFRGLWKDEAHELRKPFFFRK